MRGDGGSDLVQIAGQLAGLAAREQARAPATGDEERNGKAQPAGQECAGRVAHPPTDSTSLAAGA
jgi:hypothetical protein